MPCLLRPQSLQELQRASPFCSSCQLCRLSEHSNAHSPSPFAFHNLSDHSWKVLHIVHDWPPLIAATSGAHTQTCRCCDERLAPLKLFTGILAALKARKCILAGRIKVHGAVNMCRSARVMIWGEFEDPSGLVMRKCTALKELQAMREKEGSFP